MSISVGDTVRVLYGPSKDKYARCLNIDKERRTAGVYLKSYTDNDNPQAPSVRVIFEFAQLVRIEDVGVDQVLDLMEINALLHGEDTRDEVVHAMRYVRANCYGIYLLRRPNGRWTAQFTVAVCDSTLRHGDFDTEFDAIIGAAKRVDECVVMTLREVGRLSRFTPLGNVAEKTSTCSLT